VKSEYRYIVVGLGGLGSAAAYWLARRAGSEVLGLEQFELGHERGASQDHSRIIRLSYHTPAYVALARRAYEAWTQLEEDAGGRLIVTTGGLDLWPPEAQTPITDYTQSLRACEVGFELLEAGDIAARWPQFHLRPGTVGLWQEASGIVAAARANSAHRRLARAHGAALRANTPVTSLRARGDDVEVTTPDGVVRSSRVVVAADAWTNHVLAPLGVTLPLRVTQEQVTYFSVPRPGDFDPERFPIWIWMGEPSFYGFPTFGEAGTKVGQDLGGREVTAASRTFETDRAALGRVEGFLHAHLPGAHGPVIYTKSCLYTMPPDRDFIVDFVPGHPNVLVAQGAAHAFKFASLLGRALSELAIDDHTDIPLEPFGMSRAALGDPSGADRTASAAPDQATPVVGGLM
jgi:sarcosine oxidase